MLSLTAGMRYKYCEGNISFRYKWDAMNVLENYRI